MLDEPDPRVLPQPWLKHSDQPLELWDLWPGYKSCVTECYIAPHV
jgi:hypothetical protein